MKVLIALVGSSEHLSGVTRHAANMIRCLLTRPEISEIHAVIAPWQLAALQATLDSQDPRLHLHQVAVRSNSLSRNFWYYVRLPKLAKQLGVDLVHYAYPAPLRGYAFHCPTVATLHDLYPYDIPANFGFPKMLFNRLFLQQCLRAVDSITCVSESTLRRLDIHVPRYVTRKAVTIYNCVDAGPAMSEDGPLQNWQGEPFVLCVSQHRANKNIVFAMKVFRRLLLEGRLSPRTRLVIVGMEGPETKSIKNFIDENDLLRHVVLLKGIDDADLAWCYGRCEFLLAPSIVEGFGLPVVEAMLHHCRVVCSDIAAFREVGGPYCYYASLEPEGEKAFSTAVRGALANFKFRESSVERFSGARIAEAYIKLYTQLRQSYAASRNAGLVQSLERGRP